ncbi:DNA primase [Streptomyces sp. NPDC029526]|uniref:DNA primase n=1 Tax=Streptomyces sp. NPDC029526 TaxID=3155728 RepID=UPI0033C9EA9A
MNRTGLGLAIGAGYLLGRTKKLKMAIAVGGLVAGKKLNLSPKMVGELVSQQLRNNPQFKEIGDQLRGDLRGVGKAASGAMIERQLDSLADRLHGRTAQMRDQLAGGGATDRDHDEESDERDDRDEEPEDRDDAEDTGDDTGEDTGEAAAPAKKAAKKAPAKKAPEKRAPAKKAPAKKAAPAKKTAKKTAAKKTTAATRGAGSRARKGGGEG